MKKLFLIAAVVSLIAFGCKKTDSDSPTIAKYVGTVNGSYVAKDASIKVSKDLSNSRVRFLWSFGSNFGANASLERRRIKLRSVLNRVERAEECHRFWFSFRALATTFYELIYG